MAVSRARAETPEDLDAVREPIREFHRRTMTVAAPTAEPDIAVCTEMIHFHDAP